MRILELDEEPQLLTARSLRLSAALERVLRDLSVLRRAAPRRRTGQGSGASSAASGKPAGESLLLDESGPELLTVLRGQVSVTTSALAGQPPETITLFRGDSLGDVALASGLGSNAAITALAAVEGWRDLDAERTARGHGRVPDRGAADGAETVAQELRFKDALIRELGEIQALGLSGRKLEGALSVRRQALRHHGTRIS